MRVVQRGLKHLTEVLMYLNEKVVKLFRQCTRSLS